jgi:hypothetical protein
MTQPKHDLSKRPPQIRDQIPDDEVGQAQRFDARRHDDANLHQDGLHRDVSHRDALHQDALHQDAWVANFIGRLAGLVRHIGKK